MIDFPWKLDIEYKNGERYVGGIFQMLYDGYGKFYSA